MTGTGHTDTTRSRVREYAPIRDCKTNGSASHSVVTDSESVIMCGC